MSFNNPVIMWNSIESCHGTYDWSGVEAALENASRASKYSIPRLVANWTNYEKAAPDWLFDDLGAEVWTGFTYRCPVSWDPIYQEAFAVLLKVFGERYDGDPRIMAVQIICGGRYGEWNNGNPGQPGYSHAKFADAIRWHIDAYRDALPKTNLITPSNGFAGGEYEGDLLNHAVHDKGYWIGNYSGANNPGAALAPLQDLEDETILFLERENHGEQCTMAEGFEDRMTQMFDQLTPNLLTLNEASFTDPETREDLQSVIDRLEVPPATLSARANGRSPSLLRDLEELLARHRNPT
jgi:hypothetical protein